MLSAMARIAFIGFGELAATLAEGLGAPGRHELHAYLRRAPAPGSVTEARLRRAGAHAEQELSAVLSGAEVVLAAVPGSACQEVAERCAPLLSAGVLYADFASALPDVKARAAALLQSRGADYADAAVLGAAIVSGHQVPILASGPGAERLRRTLTPDGLMVDTLEGPPGAAATVKLLRSVYLKGRDALIAAMMLAARRHGVEEVVVRSIDTPGERVPFPALVERVLCSLAVHAGRRAEEIADAGELLARVDVDPALAGAGSALLRDLAALGLEDVFSGARPDDPAAVLEEIDRRWPEGGFSR